jgi:hypothetical protein
MAAKMPAAPGEGSSEPSAGKPSEQPAPPKHVEPEPMAKAATAAAPAAALAKADPPAAEGAPAVATATASKKVTKAVVGPKAEAAPSEEPTAATVEAAAGATAKPAVAAKAKTTSASTGSAKTPSPAATVAGAAATTPAAHAAAAERAAPAEAPPATGKDSPAAAPGAPGSSATADNKPTDKDIAREAWRRNLPDISSPDDTKASILIPIKGSIEGATYHVNTKPKSVVINLPKADPLITMRFYKIKREGLRNLWILKQEEGEGTTVKLMLGEAVSPSVEIKDDFVRINVRKPPDMKPEE